MTAPNDMLIDVPMNHAEATIMERSGMRVTDTKKTPPSAISNHLRDELIRILKDGDDKNGGAFTIAIATQVEKFSIAAREILMTEKMAENDLASLMMMRRRPPPGVPYLGALGNAYGSGWDSVTGLGGLGESGYPMNAPMPVNNENFGVQAIRQVVDAFRTMGESPAKLVEALALARTNGLADVVAMLEDKLGMSKPSDEGIPLIKEPPIDLTQPQPEGGLT